MTQPLTDVQAERQNETVQTQWQGAAATPILPDSNTDISYYTNLDPKSLVQKESAFNPPSTSEIHHQMWIGSFMMALMAGLASGNAAGGIVGGMWAAIGIHDYGNTLQQRAKSIPELQKAGYSTPALLKWYEDGDTAELDKERSAMQQDKFHADQLAHEADVMKQQKNFHDDEVQMRKEDRAQSQRNADRSYNLAVDNANRADARMDKQLEAQSWAEVRPAVQQSQAKQAQLGMATRDLADLRHAIDTNNKDAAAGAYNNYREHMARAVIGGAGMITKEMADEATQLPAWKDSEFAKWHLQGTGMPDQAWMGAQQAQVSGALKNETATLTEMAKNSFNSQVAGGVHPDDANKSVNRMFQGAGIGTNDYTKPLPSELPQHPSPSSAAPADEAQKYPGAPKVGSVEGGYKYIGGNPANQSSWEKV
ncbi:hypothetical protein [Lelliottia nimipressuralis]|uniref:Uncharacterized protein n=1 Tax=Lelliottia nimipressuralis TaxID=69220 RepID=A0ABD4KAR9_9ENTR|nr:hypothetical protein [Lelliottia nimipressuralis]MBF4178904.1 hypothetical protein [Lelliottia nimipressuralis]